MYYKFVSKRVSFYPPLYRLIFESLLLTTCTVGPILITISGAFAILICRGLSSPALMQFMHAQLQLSLIEVSCTRSLSILSST